MQLYAHHLHQSDYPWNEAPPWAIELREMLGLVLKNQEFEMSAVDDLAAKVAAEDTVIDSAVALLNGLPALIAAAGTDATKLAALQTDIAAKTTTLAAAVVAGTPAPVQTGAPITPAAANAQAAAAVTAAATS